MARVLARWQACSGTVQDGGNAEEEFLCVGICEVFFGYERSACIPTQIRKSCAWSFVKKFLGFLLKVSPKEVQLTCAVKSELTIKLLRWMVALYTAILIMMLLKYSGVLGNLLSYA
ncbi:hypothetical protein AVEN_101054-1 [Araneus ventricosus]|uniref:Uncharacterized protein n=1 Tax=Araneus ventricosus TaxID=182803 RepID=A0A4Y2TVL9_ARAVE|nr:hypothetical protein AVEN_101054-1 [Araneus ventricosus]